MQILFPILEIEIPNSVSRRLPTTHTLMYRHVQRGLLLLYKRDLYGEDALKMAIQNKCKQTKVFTKSILFFHYSRKGTIPHELAL